MSLTLNAAEARHADRVNTSIKESGKYIGVITRAEKLKSKKGTEGFGLSIKTDDGSTANYLDLYTVNSKGETLPSMATVQAILCCTRTKEAKEGNIEFDKWDNDARQTVKATSNGYPDLMGKRIGLVLQRELSTNNTNGKDVDRVVIYGVFEADSELTASEILDKKTQPEKVAKMVASLKSVNDRRTGASQPVSSNASHDDFESDIPF
jgi:hypothetical protein